jgi:Flp pilus assembly protein TadG
MLIPWRMPRNSAAWLKRFAGEQSGNAAMIFGLTAMVVITAGGAGVDFARAVDTRGRMAAALDAAALAVGGQTGMTDAEIKAMAQKYFDANFTPLDGHAATLSAVPGVNTISLSVSSNMPTTLLSLAGIDNIALGVSNEVERATTSKKMRVVLALDNTGSMASSGKIEALKTATHNLLDKLQQMSSAPDGDILVSIVPFAREVNVNPSNNAQTWIRWDLWDNVNGSCSNNNYDTKTDCQAHSKTWTTSNHTNWTGCVADRDQNYDSLNTAPTNTATRYPAVQSSNCPTRLVKLTNNWTTLHNKVNAMNPTGNTNITIGLAMAWQNLTGGAPFNAPTPPADTDQIIILLTDGDNTQNRWTTNQLTIDARTATTCSNVKTGNIRLYTILVMQGDEALLKGCASNDEMFYKLTSANQIVDVFDSIGTELANLHLSK